MAATRVFVISDLHLGGSPDRTDGDVFTAGTGICSASPRLADFVDWVRAEQGWNPAEDIELVINGDVFDFLCEYGDIAPDSPWRSDESLAREMAKNLERTYPIDAQESPLRALKELLASGVALTVLIGNHDIELSYPSMRRWFSELLEADGHRLRLIYDGEAYVVGDVLIEHGNRYDPWNVIDHDALRRDRSLMSRGVDTGRFNPPAGTHLVIQVFNELKKQYRFLDLLKPETETVIPLLLTLCPPSLAVLRDVAGVVPVAAYRKVTTLGIDTGRPLVSGNLSVDAEAPRVGLDDILARQLGRAEAERLFADAMQPDKGLGALSFGGSIAKKIGRYATFASLLVPGTREAVLQRLHAALQRLPSGEDFDTGSESKTYLDPARKMLGTDRFSVVVFGHTHLPKCIEWSTADGRSCTYLNAGTWADIIRIPDACVVPSFADARDALSAFAADLATNDYAKHVRRPCTYAEVKLEDDRAVEGRVWRFDGAAAPRLPPDIAAQGK